MVRAWRVIFEQLSQGRDRFLLTVGNHVNPSLEESRLRRVRTHRIPFDDPLELLERAVQLVQTDRDLAGQQRDFPNLVPTCTARPEAVDDALRHVELTVLKMTPGLAILCDSSFRRVGDARRGALPRPALVTYRTLQRREMQVRGGHQCDLLLSGR